jgi:histidyl-tRNA synthetase
MTKRLSTEPYKGTRDFYPEDMAIQRYIFDTWSKTAELFGFERYDASVLEPSELYKSKGAENEEMVNEQTYTFIDRGDREVTLRPEMTPTVARMIAGKRRELSFPARWYSIPNLFRYERPQRGRLREHWQLNCDMFGADGIASDVEIIALAHRLLSDFGATPDMFGIKVNHRAALNAHLSSFGIIDEARIRAVTNVIDKKAKVSAEEFATMLNKAAGCDLTLPDTAPEEVQAILDGLVALGITNAVYDPSIVRGFNYYTGTVFEMFDTSTENNRSLLGGGRYDDLTGMFDTEAVTGIGFGMGDVTMRDFLETHGLLPDSVRVTAPALVILPTDAIHNLPAEKIAQQFRNAGVRTSVDLSAKKIGKKIASASDAGARFILVVGENELSSNIFSLKNLSDSTEHSGFPENLIAHIV